jgi:hypothetical protein
VEKALSTPLLHSRFTRGRSLLDNLGVSNFTSVADGYISQIMGDALNILETGLDGLLEDAFRQISALPEIKPLITKSVRFIF